jgi:O-antigen/teichoic acid export membrane protein
MQLQESMDHTPVGARGRLAWNTVFNFAGQALPLLAGLLLIPYIVREFGPARFGMLGIIWVVFGYFTMMDLGLGRATTKFVAEWLHKGEIRRISSLVWSAVLVQLLLGAAGGAIVGTLAPLLAERLFKTSGPLLEETSGAFRILAATLPVVLAAGGLRAVLEGYQRFDLVNLLRIPSSSLAFVIPALGAAAGLRLPGVVLALGISRLGLALAYAVCCLHVLPSLRSRQRLCLHDLKLLLSFGGWISAANLLNPLLLSLDRILLGTIASLDMVGYYTAPYEAVTKLWLIPASLTATIYPACSALGVSRKNELQALYSRSVKYIFCALAPISVVLIVFARSIVGAWLGPGFVEHSALPLQLLSAGVFINCFAHVPYCFLQALGHPDLPAKLLLWEVLPHALLTWWLIERYGIAGAAGAWSIRAAIEVAVLFVVARRALSLSPAPAIAPGFRVALAALGVLGFVLYATHALLQRSVVLDLAVCAAWVVMFGISLWKRFLDEQDRAPVLALIAPIRNLLGRSPGAAEAQ